MMSPSRREVNLNLAKRHVRLAIEKARRSALFLLSGVPLRRFACRDLVGG